MRIEGAPQTITAEFEDPGTAENGFRTAFNRALGSMWMAFQPLVCWSEQRVMAYEGLLRCREPSLARTGRALASGRTSSANARN